MVARAVDYETAQQVVVSVGLARMGACAAVLERVTGFGKKWVRTIVKQNGGQLARRMREPSWFEADQERLLQGRFVVMMYERQRANRSPAVRLLESYLAYREVVRPPGVLDVNDSAQLIELYQTGNAWGRCCSSCEETFLIVYERQVCPNCRFIGKAFCRGCAQPLENPLAVAYCDSCALQNPRVASRRRRWQVNASMVTETREEHIPCGGASIQAP